MTGGINTSKKAAGHVGVAAHGALMSRGIIECVWYEYYRHERICRKVLQVAGLMSALSRTCRIVIEE
jgi:hypothetical protein